MGVGLVILAVLFFSSSAVFVRLAAPISPYEITFLRMVLAACAPLAAIAVVGRRKVGSFPRDRRYLFYGLVAALHFLLYVTSLSFTSIAHALSITYTSPIFIALGSWWLLGERLSRRQLVGVALAVVGIAVLAGFQPHITVRMLIGDGLALLSAICFAAYSIAGRSERERCHLLPYAAAVYSLAALWLVPAFVAGFAGAGRPDGTPGGLIAYTPGTILAVLGAGILPLGIGHTLYNASVRRIPATYTNLIATQEVTGGVLLGVILLGEMPSPNSIVGAVIALVGIALVLL